MCFGCGCEWRVVHVGKENKIPFLWCSDKDFYAFYFKSKLNHFLLNFPFFPTLRTSIVLCARVMLCTVSLGGFHEQEKLLNSHYLPMFSSWWRNLWWEVRFCVHLRILIECDPGIRANSAWKRTTNASASNDSDAFMFMQNANALMSNTESNKTNIKYTTKCNLCKFGARFKQRLKIWKFFRNNFLHNSRTAANEAWLRPFLAITRRN